MAMKSDEWATNPRGHGVWSLFGGANDIAHSTWCGEAILARGEERRQLVGTL